MKKILFLAIMLNSAIFADVVNEKKCETITLSKYTKLISCHNMSYLVEYKIENDISESDSIKKITLITPTSQKVIRQ